MQVFVPALLNSKMFFIFLFPELCMHLINALCTGNPQISVNIYLFSETLIVNWYFKVLLQPSLEFNIMYFKGFGRAVWQ
jgi:hypothetical protein